jgi:hypothetical protein
MIVIYIMQGERGTFLEKSSSLPLHPLSLQKTLKREGVF